MIILDPFWNTQVLKNHDGAAAHRAILATPDSLPPGDEDFDNPHPLSILQPSVEHALLCIVSGLAGVDTAIHVHDFLADFSPRLNIERYPGYE
jgi:hypothetical protein